MKVSNIRVLPPFAAWPHYSILEVSVEAGLCGYAAVPLNHQLTSAIVNEFAGFYKSKDAFPVVPFCKSLRAQWQYCASIEHVISALELALWDIFGHLVELPLYQLIGGQADRSAKACMNVLLDCNKSFNQSAQVLKFDRCKVVRLCLIKVNEDDLQSLETRLTEIVCSYPPEIEIVLSCPENQFVSFKWARQVATMLPLLGIRHFEVNFPPYERDQFRSLARGSDLRIGAVKNSISYKEYPKIIAEGALDDIAINCMGRCGFDNAAWLMRTADISGVRPVLRNMQDPFSLAANLHLSALSEEVVWVDIASESCIYKDFIAGWKIDEKGEISVPSGSGLGIQADDVLYGSPEYRAVS